MQENPGSCEPTRIQIILPTNAYFMSGIRDFILSFIRNTTEFGEKWAYRFQSIVDELCNNAIEFGSSPGKDIILTLKYLPNQSLEIVVEDTGTGKNKTTAVEMKKILAEHSQPDYVNTGLRGRGLAKIVQEWSDELEISDRADGGLCFRAVKRLDQLGPVNLLESFR